jgi:2-iminobutanoate/2-iminopropanoate deaminase
MPKTSDIIATADAPAAIGPYSQAVKAGELLFCSGQIPLDPATGKLVEGDVTAQTERVFANIKGVLAAAGLTLDHVVKANVYLVSMSDFAAMNAVYNQQMSQPYPARTTVAVAALPAGAQVEIDVTARF